MAELVLNCQVIEVTKVIKVLQYSTYGTVQYHGSQGKSSGERTNEKKCYS